MTLLPDRKTLHILIASPLEADQVARIAGAAPDRAVVIHTPHLLPTPKYVADHNGTKPQLSEAEKARWLELLADADILFDFDWLAPERLPETAPRLRWVQGTSAGIGEFLERTGLARSSILITTAAGVHASALAEFTLLGLLYAWHIASGEPYPTSDAMAWVCARGCVMTMLATRRRAKSRTARQSVPP